MVGGDPLTVLHTPGHSPDHLVFWHEPSRTAFTGDLVVDGSSVMIDWSHGGNLEQHWQPSSGCGRSSLACCCRHGLAIADPERVLIAYLEHRRQRERQILAALRAGHVTVQAIAESIYDGLEPALMAAARENVRAHLEKLKAEGLAVDEHGRWRM
jgi:glyoxylase-like metal-dependent hydrolase (beta-lactamase superfamily II)